MTTTEVNTETTASTKTYKNSADIENFYRFIHENSLRREAHTILTAIHGIMTKKKKGRKKKTATNLH